MVFHLYTNSFSGSNIFDAEIACLNTNKTEYNKFVSRISSYTNLGTKKRYWKMDGQLLNDADAMIVQKIATDWIMMLEYYYKTVVARQSLRGKTDAQIIEEYLKAVQEVKDATRGRG